MSLSFKGHAGRGRNRFAVVLILLVLLTVLAAYFIQKRVEEFNRVPAVVFNTMSVVRVPEVSRVYRIDADSARPETLWFSCEEGLWVLDENEFKWKRLGLDRGLASESVHGVAFLNHKPVIATAKGMVYAGATQDTLLPVPNTEGLNILALDVVNGTELFFYAESAGLFLLKDPAKAPAQVLLPELELRTGVTCLKALGNSLFIGREGKPPIEYYAGSHSLKTFSLGRIISKRTIFPDIFTYGSRVWLASSDDGMWVKEAASDTFYEDKAFPARGAYVFAAASDGFWCGTPWGLWRYYAKGGAWMQFVHPQEKNATDFQVFALHNAGKLLWYGSRDLGGGYFNTERVNWQPLHAGLSRRNVAALAVLDREVITGYGYQGGFLDRFGVDTLQYHGAVAPEGETPDVTIQTLAVSGKRLYLGGFESFSFYDIDRDVYRFYGRNSKLPAVDIAQIIVQGAGSPVLLASLFGIIEYFPAADSFHVLDSTRPYRITSLLPEGDSLFFGTLSNGLLSYSSKAKKVTRTWLPGDSRIVGIAGDSGFIYTAETRHGFWSIDRRSGAAKRIPIPDSLLMPYDAPANDIMAMRRIDNEIWLGTRNNGCLIYNLKTQDWRTFTYYQGLVTDQVRSLFDDSRFVWVGGYGGFTRLEKEYLHQGAGERIK